MVHVSYAMTDKNGTYSKYIGAFMCSLFERTNSWVTIHLLHDDTLTEKNRDYWTILDQIVKEYTAKEGMLYIRNDDRYRSLQEDQR